MVPAREQVVDGLDVAGGQQAEASRPEPGATLAGTAVSWDHAEITTKAGEKAECDVLTVRGTDGDEHAVWTWHTVLQRELLGNVQPGDFVAIHYRGKRPRLDGNGEYASYRVAIQKADNSTGVDGIPY